MSGNSWVTLATNDSYSLGAMVVARSLRRVGTAHDLTVLVTPGVTAAMRNQLSSVFTNVVSVDILDSKDEENLKLLTRPELGVTFTKIHCWKLTQYSKCVFLDADVLVLKNCDELFDREELSAAPDVGWPDCFNSGVFVYRPSLDTYNAIINFALTHGSFDGGDQGLLNMFFSDWATQDISRHLPFIYNMCSTATYSYLPAFKQFGTNVKIVHFIGAAKPWLQYLDTETRQVKPSPGSEHLKGLLQMWWDIFCHDVHSTLTRDMAGLAGAFSQLTLGVPRTAEQIALEDHLRKQAWEYGTIDYMGRDSFDNIWRKICETLSQAPQAPETEPVQLSQVMALQADGISTTNSEESTEPVKDDTITSATSDQSIDPTPVETTPSEEFSIAHADTVQPVDSAASEQAAPNLLTSSATSTATTDTVIHVLPVNVSESTTPNSEKCDPSEVTLHSVVESISAPTEPASATIAPSPAESVSVTTPAPVISTSAPVTAQSTPAPVESIPAPVGSTPAPVESTPAPVASTPAPVESIPAPVESTPAPVESTLAPVESTPAPGESTPAPVKSIPASVESTPVPVVSDLSPAESSPATVIVESTPAPTKPTSPSAEITPASTKLAAVTVIPAPVDSVPAPADSSTAIASDKLPDLTKADASAESASTPITSPTTAEATSPTAPCIRQSSSVDGTLSSGQFSYDSLESTLTHKTDTASKEPSPSTGKSTDATKAVTDKSKAEEIDVLQAASSPETKELPDSCKGIIITDIGSFSTSPDRVTIAALSQECTTPTFPNLPHSAAKSDKDISPEISSAVQQESPATTETPISIAKENVIKAPPTQPQELIVTEPTPPTSPLDNAASPSPCKTGSSTENLTVQSDIPATPPITQTLPSASPIPVPSSPSLVTQETSSSQDSSTTSSGSAQTATDPKAPVPPKRRHKLAQSSEQVSAKGGKSLKTKGKK